MLFPSRSTLLIHQAKLISSLWKQRSRKSRSALPDADPVHVVDPPDRPGVDRRVEVGELPLVGGDLAVGMLELLEQQDPELLLGVLRIDQGEGDALEGQVPGGEPGVLPLVGHGHHPHRVEVPPVLVADLAARLGGGGIGVVAVEPDVRRRRGSICLVQSSPANAWRWIRRSSSVACGGWIAS